MLDGKRFLAPTGMPILNSVLERTMLEVWDPDPLIVATWMETSLTMRLALMDLLSIGGRYPKDPWRGGQG